MTGSMNPLPELPAAEGLCQVCVDKHNCPMVNAVFEAENLPRHDSQAVHMEGHSVIWCPMYG